jgi:hypothetical protein
MLNTLEQKTPTHDQIALLAYHFWEEQGRPSGQDVEHWLMAERRILAERAVTASANVPKQETQRPPFVAPSAKNVVHPPRTGLRPRAVTSRRKLGGATGISAHRPGSLVGTAPISCAFEGPLND